MTQEEIIWIASKAFSKKWTYEELMYSDDLYGHNDVLDEVWKYVEEIEATGTIAFYEKYKDINLY